MKTPKCPICKTPTTLDRSNAHRPFCSERCKMVDLASWLDGAYAFPGERAPDEQRED